MKDLAKSTNSESGGSSPAGKEERDQSLRRENIRPRSRSPTILEMSPQLIRKKLECVDINQYIRKTNIEPLLQTDELNQQQAMQKAEEVHQFRQYRARLLSIRDIEQEERFKEKDRVLEMYGEMRDSLDEARQKIFNIREEYRNKLLEAERLRLEAQAAEEAASRVEPEKKEPVLPTAHASPPARVMSYVLNQEGSFHYRIIASPEFYYINTEEEEEEDDDDFDE
ncbi:hypothetical protein MJG53_009067 [Ovis ammon polii x Ovis aries]|uniref:Uncharacterized protein n=1 Tax=Ovis ammon polii x Ovis aries TaxID=2918886 RepID=A0ACB9UZ78_9CETA|nr:hypothetical protein MJG53_009067 [Ovis ammon polii x Ovis aries]